MRQKFCIYMLFSFAFTLSALHAEAVQRAHVSALAGSDANTATGCTAVAPCRFFQAAMSVVDSNGEVVALDSGGYGAVTITKSLALIAPTGVYAGISVFPGSDGVTIATPNINVTLRGITINGQGGGSGVMSRGNQLTIENCVIANMQFFGISLSGGVLRVINSIILNNGGEGIFLTDGADANITRSYIGGNNAGVWAQGGKSGFTNANISDSVIDGNRREGVYVTAVLGPARATLHGNRITRNVYGLRIDGSQSFIRSAGNNLVDTNTTDVSGNVTTIGMR
jgi:Right handed beta helix region